MAENKEHKCAVCGKPSPQTICEPCQAHIQAEAVGKKKKSEKGVKVGGDVLADKAAAHKSGSK
ncbi:MAG: hypothetical protein ACR2NW_03985 [Thermodesulfobacteriota bacterium]